MAATEGISPSAQALRTALESGCKAVIVADRHGHITYASPAALALTRASSVEAFPPDLQTLLPEGLPRVVTGEPPPAVALRAAVHDPASHDPASHPVFQVRHVGDETVLLAAPPAVVADSRLRFSLLAAEATDRAIAVTDAGFQILFANSALARFAGKPVDSLLNTPLCRLLAEDGCEQARIAEVQAQMALGQRFEGELELTVGGRPFWVSARLEPMPDAGGGPGHIVVFLTEITQERALQRLQRDVLAELAENYDLPRLATNLCRLVQVIAPDVACSILLVDEEKRLRPLAGPSLPEGFADAVNGLSVGPEVGTCGTAAYFGRSVMTPDIGASPAWRQWNRLPLAAGLRACWSHPIRLQDGRIAGAFALYFRDRQQPSAWHQQIVHTCLHLSALAIERHEARGHIERLAYFDPLTGLPNRRMLQEKLEAVLSLAAAGRRPATLLLIDIDRFKTVNDARGHNAGDTLLLAFAERLQSITTPDEFVSRLSGDEFVLVSPDSSGDDAAALAERILKAVAQPFEIDGLSLPVSASIGISVFPDDSPDAETMLKHADTAMFEAKSAGRGRLRFFSPAMNRLAQERLLLGAALSDAVRGGRLKLHYQPQTRTADGVLHGVEALARWHDPVLGDISPAKFIPLAEEIGLIDAIARWALDAACRQLADWRARGLAVPGVSVNLSPINARDPGIAGFVAEVLSRYRLAPELLTIEITESVMVDTSAATMASLAALHAMGVKLSMDDFGAGYSSLSSIAHLPVTEVKIDRQFMLRMEEEPNARTVIAAVVRIGHGLGLTVVSEGVETAAQHALLRELDCHVVQGFLIAPPLSPEAFEQWLETRPPPLPDRAASHGAASFGPIAASH